MTSRITHPQVTFGLGAMAGVLKPQTRIQEGSGLEGAVGCQVSSADGTVLGRSVDVMFSSMAYLLSIST